MAQQWKNLPAMQETWVWSLCSPGNSQKHSTPQFKSINAFVLSFLYGPTLTSIGEEMATHSSTIAWKTPWAEEPGRLQSMGSWRVRRDWATHFHFSLSCTGEGNSNPLQCSCLENPRESRAWWAAVCGVAQSRTRLKRFSSSSSSSGSDRIPVELFQILKDGAVKVLHSIW